MQCKTWSLLLAITCGYEHMTRVRRRRSRRVPPDQGLCYRCRPDDTRGAIMEQTVGAGMGIVVFLLIVAGTGLLIGALARLALPGPDPMSWPATLGYGLVGSVLGGLVSRLLHVPAVSRYRRCHCLRGGAHLVLPSAPKLCSSACHAGTPRLACRNAVSDLVRERWTPFAGHGQKPHRVARDVALSRIHGQRLSMWICQRSRAFRCRKGFMARLPVRPMLRSRYRSSSNLARVPGSSSGDRPCCRIRSMPFAIISSSRCSRR